MEIVARANRKLAHRLQSQCRIADRVDQQTIELGCQSLEIGLAINPLYGCCTTTGGVVALDTQTGEKKSVQTERFKIIEQVDGDDYSALVKAHSAALKQLAEQLTNALMVND